MTLVEFLSSFMNYLLLIFTVEAEGSEPSSESSSKELLQTYQDLIRRWGKNPEKITHFGSGISHPGYRIVGIESHYNTGDPPRDEKGRCLRFFRREATRAY